MTLPASVSAAAPAPSMALPTFKRIFDEMGVKYGLTPRDSQLKLAEYTRSAIIAGGIACIEAPTGTGKTLGYLAGALDAQAHSGSPVPIVIATATVGLQEQILRDDIPRLAAVGAVDIRKVAVAKGRGRYFCPRTTALLEDKKMRDNQFDMFNEDKHVAEGGTVIALDMLHAWREGRWDGDKDSWKDQLPSCWASTCAASSDTCVNRACDHYEKCPYINSRLKLATAQVIIANHDIVLADLRQRAEEQTSTVLPAKKYALIFDEAHNLPDKAVASKKAYANLSDTDWLRKLEPYGEASLAIARIAKVLTRSSEFPVDIFSVGATTLANGMEALGASLAATQTFDEGGVCSWGLKAPDSRTQGEVVELREHAFQLLMALKAMAKVYSEYAEEAVGADKAFAIRMLAQTHTHHRMANDLAEGFELFSSIERMVRWTARSKKDGKISLNSQPLEGNEVLNDLLWKSEIPVVMVSATLQISGSFERFRDKSGLPARAVTDALAPVFDYSRGFLHQPKMDTTPGDNGYEQEVREKLEILFDKKISNGMLVLFTSRDSMKIVAAGFSDKTARCVLMQGNSPVPELIAQHKARIDKGERSMLIGLDSMAEGLDLPGKYCGHVVITRLPFAPPGDPVESARREHLGSRWFPDAYLADMLTMLIQATGRLIRRETDHGVITVLDKRLSTKRYAMDAVKSLPGFSRGVKLSEYFEIAKKRTFDMTFGAKPHTKLVLVTAAKAKNADVADVVAKPTVVAPAPAPVGPLTALRESLTKLTSTRAAVAFNRDTLASALRACMPPVSGPFVEGEPDYLGNRSVPCLPVGSPTDIWGERQMPQAVMLGLHFRNRPWDESAPAWLQVLSLRPDLIQFAQVLRSHVRDQLDVRNAWLSEEACREQLSKGLAGLGNPTEDEILRALDTIEMQVIDLLSESHILPGKKTLTELSPAAYALARELRQAA